MMLNNKISEIIKSYNNVIIKLHKSWSYVILITMCETYFDLKISELFTDTRKCWE